RPRCRAGAACGRAGRPGGCRPRRSPRRTSPTWRSGRATGGRSRGSARQRPARGPPAAGCPSLLLLSVRPPAPPPRPAPAMRVSRSRWSWPAAYAGGMAPVTGSVTSWRILLADDHLVVRAGLRALLAADVRCEIVGEASSIGELRALAHNLRPDLIVL